MELTDGSRVCTDCGHYFRVSDGEKRQLERLGYQLPVRCLACRRLRKELAAREADCRQADCRQAEQQ